MQKRSILTKKEVEAGDGRRGSLFGRGHQQALEQNLSKVKTATWRRLQRRTTLEVKLPGTKWPSLFFLPQSTEAWGCLSQRLSLLFSKQVLDVLNKNKGSNAARSNHQVLDCQRNSRGSETFTGFLDVVR